MQINLDIVVRMKCADLHVNVQDASSGLYPGRLHASA